MEQNELNLMQKLAKIRGMADVVIKGKKGYNYKYSDITEILAKVTGGMKKYGVSLIPTVCPGTASVTQNVTVNTKVDKTGKAFDSTTTEMLVTADMTFRWVNDDNPEEFIDVPWFVTGSQQDPSQAFGSGLTYCTRYFLTNYFQIGQTDTDVDTYRSKQKSAIDSEEKEIAASIIAEFDRLVRLFLEHNQDKAGEVRSFVKKFVANGDYTKIKEPILASKLLEEFKKNYSLEE